MLKHIYDMKTLKTPKHPPACGGILYIYIFCWDPNGLIPTVSSASWRSASKRLFSACSAETWQCWGDGLDSFNPIHWLWHRWCFRFWMAVDEKLRSFILRPHYAEICRNMQKMTTSKDGNEMEAAPGQSEKHFRPAGKLQDSQRQEAETPQIHEMVRIEKECWFEESGRMFESEWSQELHLCLVCFTQLDVLNLFLAIIFVLLQITWRVQSHCVRSQARDPKLRSICSEAGNHLGFGRNADKVLHLHLSTGLMCCFGSTTSNYHQQ